MDPDYTFESKEKHNIACDSVFDIVRCVYTSCGVNRYTECIATHSLLPDKSCSTREPYNLLAYGSDQSICLCSSRRELSGDRNNTGLSIVRTLKGHNSPVRCLRWVPLNECYGDAACPKHLLLISLDSNGKVICWASNRSSIILNSKAFGSAKVGGDWYRLLEFQLPIGHCSPNSIDASLIGQPCDGLVQLVIDVAADRTVFAKIATFRQVEYDADSGCSYLPSLCPVQDEGTEENFTSIDRKPSLCLCLRTLVISGSGTDGPSILSALHFIFIGLDNGFTEVWCQHLKASTETKMMEPLSQFVLSARLSGHTDWVRCLDWCPATEVGTKREAFQTYPLPILIASGGQDHVIRLWRMFSTSQNSNEALTTKSLDVLLPSSIEPTTFSLAIAAESVLAGHTNWVTSVAWAHPAERTGAGGEWSPQLLSASMDKSLIVWSPVAPINAGAVVNGLINGKSRSDGQATGADLWLESARLGSLSDTGLGFLGCAWQYGDATTVYGLHFQGSLSMWSLSPGDSGVWSAGDSLSGHVGAVMDIAWAVDCEDAPACTTLLPLLFTAGSDQTVRLHIPSGDGRPRTITVGQQDVAGKDAIPHEPYWLEVARPQVHGYDMTAISALSPISYVSAGDEKVVRVFSATRGFATTFERVSGAKLTISDRSLSELAVGAVQPSLGLSNQIIATDTVNSGRFLTDSDGLLPPAVTEDHLQYNTLWPETNKLYGHAYEVFCLAAHPRMQLVASACVSAKQQHACVILWNGRLGWALHQRLVHHQLTVTQLAWCEDGSQLLAVSRDRTWSRWVSTAQTVSAADVPPQAPGKYRLAAYPTKGSGHSRIIWACAWSPDDKYFFTGSRDKNILLWPTVTQPSSPVSCRPLAVVSTLPHSVTALSSTAVSDSHCLLGVGLECGQIRLMMVRPQSADPYCQLCYSVVLPPIWCLAPDRRVRRLAFNWTRAAGANVYLAAGGDDGLLHVLRVSLDRLRTLATGHS